VNIYIVDKVCFIPHPGLSGMWIKTHRSAALVVCPQCGAQVGEPCRGAREARWVTSIHYSRRDAIKGMEDIPVAGVLAVPDHDKLKWVDTEPYAGVVKESFERPGEPIPARMVEEES